MSCLETGELHRVQVLANRGLQLKVLAGADSGTWWQYLILLAAELQLGFRNACLGSCMQPCSRQLLVLDTYAPSPLNS